MSTIYIHWPFCVSKCHYCDFNSVACVKQIDFKSWLKFYKKILLKHKEEFYKNEGITSVYFGGGTPSLLPDYFIGELLTYISQIFKLENKAELTLEANPKTLSSQKGKELKSLGINRLSIGVQSINDNDLKLLGRVHSSKEAIDCVFEMSDIFNNLSIDLIYNRPQQNLDEWKIELSSSLSLPVNHASLYELIVEDNTPLKKMIMDGDIIAPNGGSEFMEATVNIAKSIGFDQYEVSNFSKPGYEGKHNLSYWKYEDYYAVGPGSHSRVSIGNQKIAISQTRDNDNWLNWANTPSFDKEILSEDDVFKERLIMGLRSKCGIDATLIADSIKKRYNFDYKIEKLLAHSYIMIDGGKIILTYDGLLKLNLVIEYVVN